ncbi:MAG: PAS domain S-box protein [Deltaproteobacteria bacterium]|nr:PAS domain S-box protein [Deltaproteobacteria bacterium]
MRKLSEPRESWDDLRAKIIGFGERSVRKSYYPELAQRLGELDRFKTLLDHANEAIFLIELPQGRLADVNQSACEQIGRPREEVLTLSLPEVMSVSAPAEWSALLRGLQEGTPLPQTVTAALHRSDGSDVPVEMTLSAVVFERAPYAVAVARDTTERRRAAEQLSLLATAVEQAAEAIVISNADGTILYANPAFSEVTGYSREEAKSRNLWDLETGGRDAANCRAARSALQQGKVWNGHFVYRKKDGTLYDVDSSLSPVRDDAGRITHYVAAQRDVSNELRLERQIRQAQKLEALGTLAGGIAHDFNNLLMSILGYAQLALRELPEGSEIREDVERVLSAGERARALVAQILTFARRGDQELQPVRLTPLIKEVLKLLEATLPPTIELRLTGRPASDTVTADPTQIHQVLMNLCTNAAQALGENSGEIKVQLADSLVTAEEPPPHPDLGEGLYVRVTVSDTGPGMTAEVLERIFEPFFTTKEAGRGTGLGLSVAHGIVKRYGGAINVESELGRGTTFHLYLPAIAPSQPEQTRIEEDLPRGPEHVLLVDDEEAILELEKSILQEHGYRVTTAAEGLEALALFQRTPGAFDLVIADQMMPKMTGASLTRELLRLRPDLPVILCTGYHSLAGEDWSGVGFRDVLQKPVTARQLVLAVRSVLDAIGRPDPSGRGS